LVLVQQGQEPCSISLPLHLSPLKYVVSSMMQI